MWRCGEGNGEGERGTEETPGKSRQRDEEGKLGRGVNRRRRRVGRKRGAKARGEAEERGSRRSGGREKDYDVVVVEGDEVEENKEEW